MTCHHSSLHPVQGKLPLYLFKRYDNPFPGDELVYPALEGPTHSEKQIGDLAAQERVRFSRWQHCQTSNLCVVYLPLIHRTFRSTFLNFAIATGLGGFLLRHKKRRAFRCDSSSSLFATQNRHDIWNLTNYDIYVRFCDLLPILEASAVIDSRSLLGRGKEVSQPRVSRYIPQQ